MPNDYELDVDSLFTAMDAELLPFKTTAEVEELRSVIGQERAIGAIKMGIEVVKDGFNLFALGPAGIGKQSTIMQYLSQQAESRDTPPDWCYVNNFEHADKPYVLCLPAGRGSEFCRDMQSLVDDTKTSIPVAFESDEYMHKLEHLQEIYEERRNSAISELSEKAADRNIALIRGPHGFMLAPIVKGKVLDAKEFSQLAKSEQERIKKELEQFEDKLTDLLQRMPQIAREEREDIRELVRETALATVGVLVHRLLERYKDLPSVCQHLNSVKNDIADNVDSFTEQAPSPELFGMMPRELSLRKYEVNLLIDNKDVTGAPIVYEDNPVYPKLTGRVEYEARMGTMVTDFTHIQPGALHRANGGYLLLDANKLLQQPLAWDALKRILYANEISIQSIGSLYGVMDAATLEPEPIPLNVKVVLMGERLLYYLLLQYDPDFTELFKIAADFEEEMDRSDANVQLYAQLIASLGNKEGLLPLGADAVARVIEHSSRQAGDAEKLSTHMHSVVDLLQEADYWAKKDNGELVDGAAIGQAIASQRLRGSRLKEKLGSEIQRETILIDTAGELVGSINGLAVIDLRNYRFAYPVRITATTRIGDGKVVDIEREVELGGATHSKGVLILSSLLASRYCRDIPLSFTASLTFEQSYGGVEGDSASMAEFCALLSSLAKVPVRQSLAITGSVNQLGQSQAIGGVNEKIEGFFDVCKQRSLDGSQGVIIPSSNVKHLMLDREVVDAVADGKFHVYAVATVDEAIEILTGLPAGEADAAGAFPEGSINFLVEQALRELSRSRKKFMRSHKAEAEERDQA